MSTTESTTTTTTTEGPTLYEQAEKVVSDAGEAVAGFVGYEPESDAHKAGREAGEAVAETVDSAGKAVSDAVEGVKEGANAK